MIPGITLAMPVGSKWRGYSNAKGVDLGEIDVLAHRRSGLELYLHAIQSIVTMPYPANDQWALDRDHIRVGDALGNVQATYAPA